MYSTTPAWPVIRTQSSCVPWYSPPTTRTFAVRSTGSNPTVSPLEIESNLCEILTPLLDPVLLCNDLGQIRDLAGNVDSMPHVKSSGRASMSIKESARIAQSNNFMGLICRSSLLVCLILFPRGLSSLSSSPTDHCVECCSRARRNHQGARPCACG